MKDNTARLKKQWLSRYCKAMEKVERLSARIGNIESRITAPPSARITGMPRGGSPVTIEDLICQKADLEARVDRVKETAREYRREILWAIDDLEDERFAEILEYHFIDRLTIEEIADRMDYNVRHVFALYKKAVDAINIPGLEDLLGEEGENDPGL